MMPMDEDILISRVVDGRAGPEDWTALRQLAEDDPGVHARLAAAQEQQCLLVAAVDRLLPATPELRLESPAVGRRSFSWLGAAAILLSVLGGFVAGSLLERQDPVRVEGGHRRGVPVQRVDATAEPDRLRELPSVLIDSRPVPGGRGVEVTYLRRTLERAVLESVYALGRDELGNPVALPSHLPVSEDF